MTFEQLNNAVLPDINFYSSFKCARFRNSNFNAYSECPDNAEMCYYEGSENKIVMRCKDCQKEAMILLNWKITKLNEKEMFTLRVLGKL